MQIECFLWYKPQMPRNLSGHIVKEKGRYVLSIPLAASTGVAYLFYVEEDMKDGVFELARYVKTNYIEFTDYGYTVDDFCNRPTDFRGQYTFCSNLDTAHKLHDIVISRLTPEDL